MGAGSAKGANVNEDETDIDVDRFSVISRDSPEPNPQETKPNNNNNNNNDDANNAKSKIRAKIEALSEDSEDDAIPVSKSSSDKEKKEEEKKRGLFGFNRKKEEDHEKTNVFVHEVDDNGKKKKENMNRFKFFAFRKEGKKSEEKDEKLEQEIKDLQKTFDSLGLAGNNLWEDDSHRRNEANSTKKSQSADDIRDLEPMRNRMNQKRRFSRPANAGATVSAGGNLSLKKGVEGSNSGGSRRTFKYSWEKENSNSSPVRSEDWNYEGVLIEGFDIDKFKMVNLELEGSLISNGLTNGRMASSVLSDSPVSSASGTRSPLIYDPTEQKILATIERDFI